MSFSPREASFLVRGRFRTTTRILGWSSILLFEKYSLRLLLIAGAHLNTEKYRHSPSAAALLLFLVPGFYGLQRDWLGNGRRTRLRPFLILRQSLVPLRYEGLFGLGDVVPGLRTAREVDELVLSADPEYLLLEFWLDGGFEEVFLVAEEYARHGLARVVVEFADPVKNSLQTFGLRQVEYDDGSVDASEELRDHFAEPLLAGGVPELHYPL